MPKSKRSSSKESSNKKNKKSNDHISSSDSGKLKVVLVGDGSCGKSSLIHAYLNNEIPEVSL